jgi:hypothetical protein
MVFGVTHLIIELVPAIQKTAIHRSLLLKVVTLLVQTFLAVLFYQVRVQSTLPLSFHFPACLSGPAPTRPASLGSSQ